MFCEAKTGYISNMEIYTAQGKKLKDTVMSVIENNLVVHHHVYQDNFYNSVNLVGNLLKHKIRVCGTMRPNRGIAKDLEKEAKELKIHLFKEKVIYWCKFGETRD
jgi:iron-sulfur cluster repair protein YtfE (RIC family)